MIDPVEYPWEPLADPPELPADAPLPTDRSGQRPAPGALEWRYLHSPLDADLYVTFTGDGSPPQHQHDPGRLYRAWIYLVPHEGIECRFPLLEELYSALAQCPLEGILWQLPPFGADRTPELTLESRPVVMMQVGQAGAIQGTPAHRRFELTMPGPKLEEA